jgi:hypothetical protein
MGAGTIDYSTLQSTSPSTNIMMGLAIFAAAMVMAASLPLQWGGKAMQSWRGLGKNAWNKSGGAILRAARDRATERPRDFLAKRKANVEGLKQQRAAKRQGEWAQKYGGNAFGRKLVLGTNEAGVRNMQNAAVDSFKKEWGGAKLADLQKAATRNGNNPFAIRALADLAQTNFGGAEKLFAAPGEINEMGNWNDGIKDDRKIAVKKQAATALYASMQNSGFRDMIFDKNMGLAEYMQHETGDVELKKQIRGKLAAKAAHEKDAGTLGAMRELGETKDLQEIYHGYTSSDWKAIGEKGSARYKGEVSKDLGTLAGSTGFVPSQENINRIIQPEAQGEFKKQVTEKCNIPLPDAKPAEVKVNGAAIMDEAGNPVMSSKVDAEYIGTRHFFESALKNVSSGDTNKETVTIPNNQGPTPGAGPNESSML